jgi:hypothetical protein
VISASLGGAISSALLYPLEVVKTRMQSQADNHEISMISVMQDLYEQGGVAVFYHGVETSAFQSALEKALYFFAYTSLKQQYASSNNKNNNTFTTWLRRRMGALARDLASRCVDDGHSNMYEW